jgi:hypothetical protein
METRRLDESNGPGTMDESTASTLTACGGDEELVTLPVTVIGEAATDPASDSARQPILDTEGRPIKRSIAPPLTICSAG